MTAPGFVARHERAVRLRTRDRRTPRRRRAVPRRDRPSAAPSRAGRTGSATGRTRRRRARWRAASVGVAGRHVEQRAVRLDVLQPDAFGRGDAGDRGDLVEHEVFGFLRRQTCISRRPKPARSGKPGCAPTATPLTLASRIVARSTEGSPAWKPAATLADVIDAMTGPRRGPEVVRTPKDSPTSGDFRRVDGLSRRPRSDRCAPRRVYKTKGHRGIAMPLCSTDLAPPAFTAPCRNQTGDCRVQCAKGVPGSIAEKCRRFGR